MTPSGAPNSPATTAKPPAHRRLLSQLEPGEAGRVVRVHGHGPQGLRQRLLDMGVTRGAEVRVLRRAPLGDPVEFEVRGYCLALRLNEAQEVELEPLELAAGGTPE